MRTRQLLFTIRRAQGALQQVVNATPLDSRSYVLVRGAIDRLEEACETLNPRKETPPAIAKSDCA